MSDQIAKQCMDGDWSNFGLLVKSNQGRLVSVLHSNGCSNLADCDDVMQNTWLRVHDALAAGKYECRGNFGAWLKKVVLNEWSQFRRQENRLSRAIKANRVEIDNLEPKHDELIEWRDSIEAGLDELSEVERRVLELRVAGVTLKNSSEKLGINKSAVDRIFWKSLGKLRDYLTAIEFNSANNSERDELFEKVKSELQSGISHLRSRFVSHASSPRLRQAILKSQVTTERLRLKIAMISRKELAKLSSKELADQFYYNKALILCVADQELWGSQSKTRRVTLERLRVVQDVADAVSWFDRQVARLDLGGLAPLLESMLKEADATALRLNGQNLPNHSEPAIEIISNLQNAVRRHRLEEAAVQQGRQWPHWDHDELTSRYIELRGQLLTAVKSQTDKAHDLLVGHFNNGASTKDFDEQIKAISSYSASIASCLCGDGASRID